MPQSFTSMLVLSRCLHGLLLKTAIAVLPALAAPALGKTTYDNPATAEGWAWVRIKRGDDADFKDRCKTTLDARANDEESKRGWQDDCRRLRASFLADVLTKAPWRDQVPFHGVIITGARIVGDINLRNARLIRKFAIIESRIAGNVDLGGAQTESDVFLNHSLLAGKLYASDFHDARSLELIGTQFEQKVSIPYAKIDGFLSMAEALVQAELVANSLHVGGPFWMRKKASFKAVNLRRATIDGDLDMGGSTFEGKLDADYAHINSSVVMLDARVSELTGMQFAEIGGSLDLRGATLAGLDLQGASIAGELRLGESEESHAPMNWRTNDNEPSDLKLRYARIGSLADTASAWPQAGHLHLDGFAFSRLGGFQQDEKSDASSRGAEWWDEWAKRDPVYTPYPYQQLAAAFAAGGYPDLADEIRYLGRVREHGTLTGPSWVWAAFLRWVAGFGVGSYPFRVLYWVGGISLAGAVYLWKYSKGVRASGHSFLWCFGASVTRLLPVIEINKEFTDFFNDPERKRLSGFAMAFFSLIGILGWFLAAILVAAVSGVTGKS